MCQEKEEEDFPVLKTVLTHQYASIQQGEKKKKKKKKNPYIFDWNL